MYRLLFVFIVLAFAPVPVLASPFFVTGSASKQINIPLTTNSQKIIYVNLRSPSPDRQQLSVEISGPSGAVISFASAKSAPKTSRDVAKKGGKLYSGLLYPRFGSGVSSFKLGSTDSSGGGSTSGGGSNNNTGGGATQTYLCGCLTEKDVEELRQAFSQFGPTPSSNEICELFGNTATCPSTGAVSSQITNNSTIQTRSATSSTASLSAFIQDDACDSKPPVAVLKFDLSKVNGSDLTGGAITIKPTFAQFNGNRRVKIKRQGEGKYRSALLLAGPVSGGSFFAPPGDVGFSIWRGDKKQNKRSLKIADFVYYSPAGGSLWRVPLSSDIFTGGKGTFELSKDSEGYSICASLLRKDQFFNGYPRNTRGD
jgi:hypothetical protein